MATRMILDDDIVRFRGVEKNGKKSELTLFWGDEVSVSGQGKKRTVEIWQRKFNTDTGKHYKTLVTYPVPAKAKFRDSPLLKVRFVDVGQGDGAIVETPGGERVLVDGGEDESMLRYAVTVYSQILQHAPLHFDAIVVTHGDADHYAGLTKLVDELMDRKSPRITVDRVFHNGLVKRAAKGRTDKEMFGHTASKGGETFATQLEEDLRKVSDAKMNEPMKAWKGALLKLKGKNKALKVDRVEYGEGSKFGFLSGPGLSVKVFGPVTETVNGHSALQFLKTPGGNSASASHTINGHSIVLMMAYKNVRFLFGADLNEESENRLLERTRADGESLAAEILKVPHHGSADFSPRMLEAVRPVVSVVSSGDENAAKEYIHPRAGLIGALGKYSRPTVAKPLIYVTEMVAFFQRLGPIMARKYDPAVAVAKPGKDLGKILYGYNKTRFGIVHVRTDGERVLVVTHSGKDNKKESYVFRVTQTGDVEFDDKVRIVTGSVK